MERNWAGSLAYTATSIVAPRTIDALRQTVASAGRVKALGSRHSFSRIADTNGVLISTAALAETPELDTARRIARVGAGTRYGELARWLEERGWALANLASLPHISIAGAVSTGTHGSGDRTPSLADAVVAIELVTADGELRRISASAPDFGGTVVSLGALGVMSQLELRIEPTYRIAQTVYEDVPWDAVLDDLDTVTGAAYSVSLFTGLRGETIDQVWLKDRVDGPARGLPAALGARPARGPRHPLPGVDPASTTPQGGEPGPWLGDAGSAQGDADHRPVGDYREVGAGARGRGGADALGAVEVDGPLGPVQLLRLEEDHRVGVADGRAQQAVRVLRVRGRHDGEPGGVRVVRLRRVAVMLDTADAAAVRDADDHRQAHASAGAVGELGDVADDLLERRVRERVELHLHDGTHAVHGHADRRADDARFRQRRAACRSRRGRGRRRAGSTSRAGNPAHRGGEVRRDAQRPGSGRPRHRPPARRVGAGMGPGVPDPLTGIVTAVDRYTPAASQVRFLHARDQRCRGFGCRMPAHRCQKDHNIEHHDGGPTANTNLACFCIRHHVLKTETTWTVTQLRDGTLKFHSPLGNTYYDQPPPKVVFIPDSEPLPF